MKYSTLYAHLVIHWIFDIMQINIFRFPDDMEFHLRSFKPEKPKVKKREGVIFDPAHKRYDLPELDPLPPILPKQQVYINYSSKSANV